MKSGKYGRYSMGDINKKHGKIAWRLSGISRDMAAHNKSLQGWWRGGSAVNMDVLWCYSGDMVVLRLRSVCCAGM